MDGIDNVILTVHMKSSWDCHWRHRPTGLLLDMVNKTLVGSSDRIRPGRSSSEPPSHPQRRRIIVNAAA
jgi:hypothetical protein